MLRSRVLIALGAVAALALLGGAAAAGLLGHPGGPGPRTGSASPSPSPVAPAAPSGTGTPAPFHPGAMMRSASSIRWSLSSVWIMKPPWALSGPGSMAQLAYRYQPSPISGRDSPKISATMPNSKVQRPS